MNGWKPIADANPKIGDIALIIASLKNGRGTQYYCGPQLCVWEEDGWTQMLRGDSYGLGVDGTPSLFMTVELPTFNAAAADS